MELEWRKIKNHDDWQKVSPRGVTKTIQDWRDTINRDKILI
jgi:hypothetical protein